MKAEILKSKNDYAGILAVHKKLLSDKQFADNEVISKYVFSVMMKDQSLFQRELAELNKIISNTTDIRLLKTLREIFAEKGQR